MNPADVANQIGDQAGFWAEHGLPGLVIFALFAVLGLLLWLARLEVKNWREDSKGMREEHAAERTEWRESSEKCMDKLTCSVDELSKALRENRTL